MSNGYLTDRTVVHTVTFSQFLAPRRPPSSRHSTRDIARVAGDNDKVFGGLRTPKTTGAWTPRAGIWRSQRSTASLAETMSSCSTLVLGHPSLVPGNSSKVALLVKTKPDKSRKGCLTIAFHHTPRHRARHAGLRRRLPHTQLERTGQRFHGVQGTDWLACFKRLCCGMGAAPLIWWIAPAVWRLGQTLRAAAPVMAGRGTERTRRTLLSFRFQCRKGDSHGRQPSLA